jgi:hypothetical protein
LAHGDEPERELGELDGGVVLVDAVEVFWLSVNGTGGWVDERRVAG